MRVLLDTNVVLDFVLMRKSFLAIGELLKLVRTTGTNRNLFQNTLIISSNDYKVGVRHKCTVDETLTRLLQGTGKILKIQA